MTKNEEAKKALELLGMPAEQQSDICCYSLSALLKHGVYNYPVREEDELNPELCAKVKELWPYASAKGKRLSCRSLMERSLKCRKDLTAKSCAMFRHGLTIGHRRLDRDLHVAEAIETLMNRPLKGE